MHFVQSGYKSHACPVFGVIVKLTQRDEMKYLVLLMLVAVCRGCCTPEHTKQPTGPSTPGQDLQSILQATRQPEEKPSRQIVRTGSEVGTVAENAHSKLWDKSLPQLMPLNAPFIEYTKPRTFQDTIFPNGQTWNKVTSMHPDVFDYISFGDIIRFPGGDFLQNEIDKCLSNMRTDHMPVYWQTEELEKLLDMKIDLSNVQGVRDVLPYIVTKLEKMVPLYMQTTNDPSTMAVLVTRDLIKIVLHGRMKCPRTTWDKRFIENINDQLYKIANEVYQLLENLRTVLPKVAPDFLNIDQPVYSIAQDVQQHVYNDVMQYAHGLTFKDIAVVSNKLYHELKRVFEDSWQQDVSTFMEQLVSVVTEIVKDCGTCPREQIPDKNKLACWDFNKLFLERELAHIHSRVMNVIHHFLYRTCTGEDCMQYFPHVTEVFKTIIRRYISTIVQRVTMCQTPECLLDPTECLVDRDQLLEPSRAPQTETGSPLWNVLLDKLEKSPYL